MLESCGKGILLAMCLGVVSQTSLAATVLDFESLATSNATEVYAGPVYTEDGFEIRHLDVSFSDSLVSFGAGLTGQYDGSAALANYYNTTSVKLSKLDGGEFDLNSISLLEWATNWLGPTSVTFIGTKADLSTSTQTFDLDGVFGFETFTFSAGFNDLVSVEWAQSGDGHQFDNITIDQETSAVPEPTSLAMFTSLGIMGLVAARRRKRAE